MSLVVHVTSPDYLRVVNDLTHDASFDTDGLIFDETSGTLTIQLVQVFPFSEASWLRKPSRTLVSARLVIRRIEHFTQLDTEKVGRYGISQIAFDPVSRELRFETGVPIYVHAVVTSLDITVEMASPSDQIPSVPA